MKQIMIKAKNGRRNSNLNKKLIKSRQEFLKSLLTECAVILSDERSSSDLNSEVVFEEFYKQLNKKISNMENLPTPKIDYMEFDNIARKSMEFEKLKRKVQYLRENLE